MTAPAATPEVIGCPRCGHVLGVQTHADRLVMGGGEIRERTVIVCTRCGGKKRWRPPESLDNGPPVVQSESD